MKSPLLSLFVISAFALQLAAQGTPQGNSQKAAKKAQPSKPGEGLAIGENIATPVSRIRAPKGFQVELLYSVPAQEQGSWVNLCVDEKGRIYASDQYGGLYRFNPPPAGKPLDPASIEKLGVEIRGVNGMLFAFGALYVGVNDYEHKIPCGLYRITDSDGDDRPDKVELLREMDSKGDHGVHAVVLSPDQKSLMLVCGNGAKPTQMEKSSPVPQVWGEDHILPRMPDGRGFMRDVTGPGGIIYRVSPDGKQFEAFASGFRNIFDAAFNRDGELFTYDADMEYDFNTPWYRPTRINHAVSGGEFGWRNGAGKRPEFYPDNLPAVVNIGPGSPTGVAFGYGAKFPAKYQSAMFAMDWSWGKLYAIHLQPEGSTYKAVKEEFISGTPLPLTDVIIHPKDGAMYFAIGGRRVQSGVYRVTYTGSESTAPSVAKGAQSPARELRRSLEAFHGRQDAKAVTTAWPHLASSDRFVRWAARTALEHQPFEQWSAKALEEKDAAIRVEALLGLARAAGVCPQHRGANTGPVNEAMRGKILESLKTVDVGALSQDQQLTFMRALEVTFNRFERPDENVITAWVQKLDPLFPAKSFEMNWLLCETLVYLQSPTVASKALALIEKAPTQEEQIEYARSLRALKTGWTIETRTVFLNWLLTAANYRGGASFEKFVEFIRNDALATFSESEKIALAELIEKKPERRSAIENIGAMFANRTPTSWTLEQLSSEAAAHMKGRDFDRGRKVFGAAACFACHRYGNEGGMTGPDLTGAGGRYSPHDLLDQIINPSKEINEQFVPSVLTKENGETVTGVVVNLSGDSVTINTDPSDPNQRISVDRKQVKSIEPSKISPMPPGLLNMLTKDEIFDLVAYVLSSGNREHSAFKP